MEPAFIVLIAVTIIVAYAIFTIVRVERQSQREMEAAIMRRRLNHYYEAMRELELRRTKTCCSFPLKEDTIHVFYPVQFDMDVSYCDICNKVHTIEIANK